jgi:hypothetical protein
MAITCATVTVLTQANITAMSITATPSDPCIFGTCTVNISVTWTNSGQATGAIVPNITIDGVVATPLPPPENMVGGTTLTKIFTVTGLVAGPHSICPNPN